MQNNIVNVRRILNPFEPHVATSDTWHFIPKQPLCDYLEASAIIEYVVSINGKLLTPDQHKTYIPVIDDFVVLTVIPYGGDTGGKDVLRMAAMIAVSVFAAPLAGAMAPGLFAANGAALGFAGAALTAGITVAGSMIVNALLPPPKPASIALASSQEESPTYGIDGPKNTSTEGIPVPICYGEHRMGGNIIAMHTENNDNNQYLCMMLNAGEGPVSGFRSILINDRPLSDFGTDVEARHAYGTPDQPVMEWFSQVISAVNFSTTIKSGNTEAFTLTQPMDEARLDFVCPSGLYDVDGSTGASLEWTIGLNVEYRMIGYAAWTTMTASYSRSSPIRVTPTVGAVHAPVAPNPDYGSSQYSENLIWQRQIVGLEYETADSSGVYPDNAEIIRQMNEQLGHHLNTGEDSWPNRNFHSGNKERDGYYTNQPITVNVVSSQVTSLEITSSSKSGVRRSMSTGKLQRGTYEFRITRIDNYLGKGAQRYGTSPLVLTDINLIQHDGVRYKNTALLALRIKMTDNLSSIPNVTYINEGKRVRQIRREGNDLIEVYGKSDNPAWVLLDLATNLRFGGGMPMDRLVIPDVIKWAAECELKGYKWNGVIDTRANFWDTAQLILRVGHAQMVGVGTRHSIVMDRPSDPVMMFGMGNIVKGSFSQSWTPKTDRANEVDITFADRDNLHKSRTIKIVDSSSVSSGVKRQVASINFQGIDNAERAYKEGILILNMNRDIHETVSFSAPIEAIACTVGSVIIVNHDMPKWADSGRLAPGSTRTQIKVDRPLTIGEGQYKLLVTQDFGIITSGSVLDLGGNYVKIGDFDQESQPTVLKVQGQDYLIESFDEEGVYLDDLTGLSVGSLFDLIKTDVIEESLITGYDPDTSTVHLTWPLSVQPQTYANFMVGEVENVKRRYRIAAISADSINTRKIKAIEYKDSIYDETGYDGNGSIGTGPGTNPPIASSIGHVEDLVAYESAYIVNRQVVTKAVSTWTQPPGGLYKGARIYKAPLGSNAFTFDQEVTFTTSATTDIAINTPIRIKVVAIDISGNSAPISTAPIVEVTARGNLTGIDVGEVSGADFEWSGRDCKIKWRYNSVTASYEFGSEVGEADAGALDPQFLAYEVTVLNEDGSARRIEKVTDPSYVYTYEKNFDDGVNRSLVFQIRMIDIANNIGNPAILTAYNPPPVMPILTVTPTFETGIFNVLKPDDVGITMWLSKNDGELDNLETVPNPSLIIYKGLDTVVTIGDLFYDSTYYIRISPYDIFGANDLDISDVISFQTIPIDTDAIARGILDETVLTDLLRSRIDLLDADDTVVGSVNNRLKDAEDRLDQSILAAIETSGDNSAAKIIEEVQEIENDVEAIATSISILDTQMGDVNANVSTLSTTVSTNYSATAESISQIESSVGESTANITSLQTTVANDNLLVAQQLNNLTTQLIDAETGLQTSEARITSANTAISGLNNSQVEFINQISTALLGQQTSISAVASSVDGISGAYTVKINNNGNISGYGLASTNNDGVVTSEFRVEADSFSIGSGTNYADAPFTVGTVNGVTRVVIKNAIIQDAAIGTLKIAGQAVSTTLLWQPATIGVNRSYTPLPYSRSIDFDTQGFSGIMVATATVRMKGYYNKETDTPVRGFFRVMLGGVEVVRRYILGSTTTGSILIDATGIIPAGYGNRSLEVQVHMTQGDWIEVQNIISYVISVKR